jgi:hypothetical protein
MEKPLMLSQLPSPRNVLSIGALFFLFSVLALATAVSGSELVSGRYTAASGKNIVLALSIGNPSPSNLIVEQYITPGNSVQATSPKAIKVDNRQGKVKWLFRNTRSGKLQLTITLQTPLQGQVEAMARYRDPRDGQFTELRIRP